MVFLGNYMRYIRRKISNTFVCKNWLSNC